MALNGGTFAPLLKMLLVTMNLKEMKVNLWSALTKTSFECGKERKQKPSAAARTTARFLATVHISGSAKTGHNVPHGVCMLKKKPICI